MLKSSGWIACASLVAFASVISSPSATAGNGLYLVGYGTESVLMGGADVAVARDAFAANNNPAGMTQTAGQAFEVEAAMFYNWDTNHSDAFGNYRKPITNGTGVFGNGAYVRRIENSPYAVGVSLVVQGGVGWVYSGMNVNPALGGGRDDAGSTFTVVKLAPAFAWKVNDDLSLGAAFGINYLAGTQELFPNTSGPALRGFRFNGASGIGMTSKWGLQYRPADDVTIGMTYGTPVSIPLKHGYMRVNRSDMGLGVVRYDDAELQGLRLPEELALGIAFRPAAPLLVSLQTKWYKWSEALTTSTLTARNPRNAAAPPTFTLSGAINASDQNVLEIGIAYDYDRANTIYAGYNHGRRIVPARNLSPTFALIYSTHYTFGVTHRLDREWQASTGVEVFSPTSVTYDSPVFGPGTNERHQASVFHLAVGRRW